MHLETLNFSTKEFAAGIAKVCDELNEKKIAHHVLTMHTLDRVTDWLVVVVFRFDSYPSYVQFCEKTEQTPISTKEFFA